MFTFPAAEHHRPFAGTKLYCFVAEAHGCEELAQSWQLPESNSQPFDRESDILTVTLTNLPTSHDPTITKSLLTVKSGVAIENYDG